jgi:uncharacterized cupin superfamily protein
VGVEKVNVISCPVEQEPVPDGFRHRETVIGPRIGAERMGASVYEAYAGVPIWPYHYHYGVEEWLYVLSGTPVLRDAGGRGELRAGDVVCFPSGHLGAHTVEGPGRFILFSSDDARTHLAVYPDSDKIAVAPGETSEGGTDFMVVQRDAGVEYWQGEAENAPPEPVKMVRQPDSAPSRPVTNALEEEGGLGASLGASLLDATVLAIDGEKAAPYHYVCGREEWALVLEGSPNLRWPDGEEALVNGDVVCFPDGPAGARQLTSQGDRPARLLLLSTTGLPANVCYPDSGRWVIHNAPGAELLLGPVGAG